MKEIKFKTNINCSGCVSTVTPFLNEGVGEGNWAVDTTGTDKILTVTSDQVSEEKVIESVKKAGFTLEKQS